jgi:hypothetical protein
MNVTDATTAPHVDGATTRPYVYLAGATGPAQSTLLKSTDGGHRYTVATGAAASRLAPTVVAVNPTSPDEVWVNNPAAAGVAGGAWVSFDGGGTFESRCCPSATVHDIAVAATPDGGIVVLLATDGGVLRSVDDGGSWTTVVEGAATSVRMAPDDPDTLLVQTADGVTLSTGSPRATRATTGLPADCKPGGLRRDERVAATFLVDCASGGTYALVLTAYAAPKGSGGTGGVLPGGLPGGTPSFATPRQLTELARWVLPGADTNTGTVAFDGTLLYYDKVRPGEIGMVRARDGVYVGSIVADVPIGSITVDLRRNELLVTSATWTTTNDIYAIDLRTLRSRWLAQSPFRVISYDASTDGLAWIPELSVNLYRRGRTEDGAGTIACNVVSPSATSTFVAAGDGGGYVQSEDDATMYRIDKSCLVTGTYAHRVFSESNAENDSMACDTQTYFPQPAIWIRDSTPQTVSAYGVPFGYCPMPSLLDISAPAAMTAGGVAQLCAVLTNATNHRPAANRAVTLTTAGAVAGHGQTDADGRVCVPYVGPAGHGGRFDVDVRAAFSGDSALFPANAQATLGILDPLPAPPVAPPRPVAAIPPPPPPPLAVPPVAAPQPGPVPAPNPAAAPNAAQAQQAQLQANANPAAQGVVVPQRQQQPQLALARAANQIGLETNSMSVPRRRGRTPADLGVVAAALAMGCVAVAGAARYYPAPARQRGGSPPRPRSR